jgi:hypothetical protein
LLLLFVGDVKKPKENFLVIPRCHVTKRNFSFFHREWGGDFTSGIATPNECFPKKKTKNKLPHDIQWVSQSKKFENKILCQWVTSINAFGAMCSQKK